MACWWVLGRGCGGFCLQWKSGKERCVFKLARLTLQLLGLPAGPAAIARTGNTGGI